MPRSYSLTAAAVLGTAIVALGSCRPALPNIRFAPSGTAREQLRRDFALTDAERMALTPQSLRALTQAQVDEIYLRLSSGPIPDGPFRGDLFFPRDVDGHARLRDVASPVPGALGHVAALRLEHLGRMLWRGKAFFRSQGILRNRIEDLAILKPIIADANGIERLTFDGQTTWLLFPAKLSCGESRLDPSARSTVIDYSRGAEVEGYRKVPDALAGPDGLNIRDEVRIVRPGLYLGRAYFGARFGLNFTLLDPGVVPTLPLPPDLQADCSGQTAPAR
jgi:hypothetical protein